MPNLPKRCAQLIPRSRQTTDFFRPSTAGAILREIQAAGGKACIEDYRRRDSAFLCIQCPTINCSPDDRVPFYDILRETVSQIQNPLLRLPQSF